MEIRDLLKSDFGIDVLIERGGGQRDDPYIISKCSKDDALRTQLNLLSALGGVRRELWHLASVEELATNLQRIRINTVSFTPREIITEVRALYFDLGQVDGVPDARFPLVQWADPRTTFRASHHLGWLHFDETIEYPRNGAALDVSFLYSAIGAKATIYVYESSTQAAYGTPEERIAKELRSVCSDIQRVHPDANSPWPVQTAGPFALQYFLIGNDVSVAGVAVLGPHILKLRLTYFDDLDMRKLMNESTMELIKLANLAMKNSA